MTRKHIELGILELPGNKVLLPTVACIVQLLVSSLRKLNTARKMPYVTWVCMTEKQVDIKKDKGVSSVIMAPCSRARRSSFYLVYAQNKCLELTKQNLLKSFNI